MNITEEVEALKADIRDELTKLVSDLEAAKEGLREVTESFDRLGSS